MAVRESMDTAPTEEQPRLTRVRPDGTRVVPSWDDLPHAWIELDNGQHVDAELTCKGGRRGWGCWEATIPGTIDSRHVRHWIAINLPRPYVLFWDWTEA